MATLATRHVTRELPQADDVRGRVLTAAERVFAERGYAGATTREIAEQAGIGKRMLFYYFPSKDAVYRAVLERVIQGLVAIYEQTRGEPGPIGLADGIEGITHFTARNLPGMKVWLREIIDGGPHLSELTRRYMIPLYEHAGAGVANNMATGTFRPGDPMHLMVNVGGVTLFYFLIAPMLRIIWDRDPLDPGAVAERAAAARECLLHGLAGPAGPKEASS
ncbi:MAG: TetR/AcrR family transcriptional regulator [Candidatus Binatia bacterium]